MRIAGILQGKGDAVASVAPGASVQDIVGELTTRRIGALLVLDGESVVGVVSERDVVRGLAGHQGDVLGLKARDIMTSPVIVILRRSVVPNP